MTFCRSATSTRMADFSMKKGGFHTPFENRAKTLKLKGNASVPNSINWGVGAVRLFAKQLAILEKVAPRVLEVEVNSPGLLRSLMRIFQNGLVGAHQSVFNMTNGKHLVGASGRRALDFASKHSSKITQRVHAALLLRCRCVLREHVVYVHQNPNSFTMQFSLMRRTIGSPKIYANCALLKLESRTIWHLWRSSASNRRNSWWVVNSLGFCLSISSRKTRGVKPCRLPCSIFSTVMSGSGAFGLLNRWKCWANRSGTDLRQTYRRSAAVSQRLGTNSHDLRRFSKMAFLYSAMEQVVLLYPAGEKNAHPLVGLARISSYSSVC